MLNHVLVDKDNRPYRTQVCPDGTVALVVVAITEYGMHASTHAPGAADPIDFTAVHLVGTLAARPAAAAANNGLLYLATDDEGGRTSRSNGATWVDIAAPVNVTSAGTLAARPAAAAGNTGNLYLATDTKGGTLYRSTGAAWVVASAPVNSLDLAAGGTVVGATAFTAQIDANGGITSADNVIVDTAGKGLQIKEGANATSGLATLVAGTVTVATTAVTATSRIQLTAQALGTVATPMALAVTARVAATSFTITSADGTDTSTVAWMIVNPAA